MKVGGLGDIYTGIGSTYRHNGEDGTGEWKTYYFAIYNGDTGQFTKTTWLY